VTTVVVEHRDRLGRMNIELVEAALESAGRRLVVLDEGSRASRRKVTGQAADSAPG